MPVKIKVIDGDDKPKQVAVRYQKQVTTTLERHGKDHYKKIGAIGGSKSPGAFKNRELARAAVNKRWANRKAK